MTGKYVFLALLAILALVAAKPATHSKTNLEKVGYTYCGLKGQQCNCASSSQLYYGNAKSGFEIVKNGNKAFLCEPDSEHMTEEVGGWEIKISKVDEDVPVNPREGANVKKVCPPFSKRTKEGKCYNAKERRYVNERPAFQRRRKESLLEMDSDRPKKRTSNYCMCASKNTKRKFWYGENDGYLRVDKYMRISHACCQQTMCNQLLNKNHNRMNPHRGDWMSHKNAAYKLYDECSSGNSPRTVNDIHRFCQKDKVTSMFTSSTSNIEFLLRMPKCTPRYDEEPPRHGEKRQEKRRRETVPQTISVLPKSIQKKWYGNAKLKQVKVDEIANRLKVLREKRHIAHQNYRDAKVAVGFQSLQAKKIAWKREKSKRKYKLATSRLAVYNRKVQNHTDRLSKLKIKFAKKQDDAAKLKVKAKTLKKHFKKVKRAAKTEAKSALKNANEVSKLKSQVVSVAIIKAAQKAAISADQQAVAAHQKSKKAKKAYKEAKKEYTRAKRKQNKTSLKLSEEREILAAKQKRSNELQAKVAIRKSKYDSTIAKTNSMKASFKKFVGSVVERAEAYRLARANVRAERKKASAVRHAVITYNVDAKKRSIAYTCCMAAVGRGSDKRSKYCLSDEGIKHWERALEGRGANVLRRKFPLQCSKRMPSIKIRNLKGRAVHQEKRVMKFDGKIKAVKKALKVAVMLKREEKHSLKKTKKVAKNNHKELIKVKAQLNNVIRKAKRLEQIRLAKGLIKQDASKKALEKAKFKMSKVHSKVTKKIKKVNASKHPLTVKELEKKIQKVVGKQKKIERKVIKAAMKVKAKKENLRTLEKKEAKLIAAKKATQAKLKRVTNSMFKGEVSVLKVQMQVKSLVKDVIHHINKAARAAVKAAKASKETAQTVIRKKLVEDNDCHGDHKWACYAAEGAFVPARINRVRCEVECLSLNGKKCEWAQTKTDCEMQISKHAKTFLVPLTCDDKIYARKDHDESQQHWCDVVRDINDDNLSVSSNYKDTVDMCSGPEEWFCHPKHFAPMRFNNGECELECQSNDGESCAWVDSYEACQRSLPVMKTLNTKALNCQDAEANDEKNVHWCKDVMNFINHQKILKLHDAQSKVKDAEDQCEAAEKQLNLAVVAAQKFKHDVKSASRGLMDAFKKQVNVAAKLVHEKVQVAHLERKAAHVKEKIVKFASKTVQNVDQPEVERHLAGKLKTIQEKAEKSERKAEKANLQLQTTVFKAEQSKKAVEDASRKAARAKTELFNKKIELKDARKNVMEAQKNKLHRAKDLMNMVGKSLKNTFKWRSVKERQDLCANDMIFDKEKKKCVCKQKGYKIHSSGKCYKAQTANYIPLKDCGANEKWVSKLAKCKCKSGYKKHHTTGKCYKPQTHNYTPLKDCGPDASWVSKKAKCVCKQKGYRFDNKRNKCVRR